MNGRKPPHTFFARRRQRARRQLQEFHTFTHEMDEYDVQRVLDSTSSFQQLLFLYRTQRINKNNVGGKNDGLNFFFFFLVDGGGDARWQRQLVMDEILIRM